MHTCTSYSELKIDGPPLFKQGCIHSNDSTRCTSNTPPLDVSKTALLVVDVQPEYWSECPAVRKDFPNFPSRIRSLVQNCREQNVKRIIWVRAAYNYEDSPWLHQFTRLHQGRIPPVVEQSTEWEEFATPLDDELVITKTSWSSTSGNTGLLDILKSEGIESVLVCGLITSVCVQHSAFGVFEAGFRTILVTDACADRGKERHKAALALYGDYMYELKTVECLRTELDSIYYNEHRSICTDCDDNLPELKRSLTAETSLSDDSIEMIDDSEYSGEFRL
jgi:nicotinamidase-related amidase